MDRINPSTVENEHLRWPVLTVLVI